MARTESRTKASIWMDEDFLALTGPAQRLYWLLYSQPTITLVGILAYTPGRWATFAKGETPESVNAALDELEAASFVLVDRSTEEVLVRTFMRNDRVTPANFKIWHSAIGSVNGIVSSRLRQQVQAEMDRIVSPEGPPEDVHGDVHACARDDVHAHDAHADEHSDAHDEHDVHDEHACAHDIKDESAGEGMFIVQSDAHAHAETATGSVQDAPSDAPCHAPSDAPWHGAWHGPRTYDAHPPSPSPTKRKEKTCIGPSPAPEPTASPVDNSFEEAWKVYPRKTGKLPALKAYRARMADPAGPSPEVLLLAARNYAADCAKTRRETQFTLLGSTFFGPNERWKDYLETVPEQRAFTAGPQGYRSKRHLGP